MIPEAMPDMIRQDPAIRRYITPSGIKILKGIRGLELEVVRSIDQCPSKMRRDAYEEGRGEECNAIRLPEPHLFGL